jgi:hypothetical protein
MSLIRVIPLLIEHNLDVIKTADWVIDALMVLRSKESLRVIDLGKVI